MSGIGAHNESAPVQSQNSSELSPFGPSRLINTALQVTPLPSSSTIDTSSAMASLSTFESDKKQALKWTPSRDLLLLRQVRFVAHDPKPWCSQVNAMQPFKAKYGKNEEEWTAVCNALNTLPEFAAQCVWKNTKFAHLSRFNISHFSE